LTAGKNSVEAASNLPKGSSARRTKIGEGLLLIFDQRNMALESASAARDEYTKELRAARDELSQLSIAVADLTKRANALQQSVAVCNLPGEQNELPATQAVDALLKRTDEAFNAVIAAYDLVPVLDQLTAAEADAKAVLR
jgi:hypothetical protein